MTPPNVLSVFPALRTFGELYAKAALRPADQLTGWSLADRDPNVIEQLIPWWSWLYHHYFRATSDGWQHIPADGPVLLVGSHNGGLTSPDMFMMMVEWYWRFGTERLAYGLMHPKVWQGAPQLARLAAQGGAIQAHPKMAIAALRQGASVLVYPGGIQDLFRPYSLRHTIYLNNHQGFIKLALRESVPIIPVISCGAHETFLIFADLYPQFRVLHEMGMPWPLGVDPEVCPVYIGLPWGIGIGPLPHIPFPTTIRTRICAPIRFERYGADVAKDMPYVQHCYQTVHTAMQAELDQLARSSTP
jgi:1-acyl-sn-glycerol-3-phosphate acyltransferase